MKSISTINPAITEKKEYFLVEECTPIIVQWSFGHSVSGFAST